MKKAFAGSALILGFVLAGTGAWTAPALAAGDDGECVCTMEFNPVIGSDGKTYPNACAAGCEGVEVVGPADGATEPEPQNQGCENSPYSG